jgi:hypothetical protein
VDDSNWFGTMAMAVMVSTIWMAVTLIWVTTTDPLSLVVVASRLLALVW